MKKRILSGLFALAFLATTGYSVNKSMKSDAGLSDLTLMNVEALANGENPGDSVYETYELIDETYIIILDNVIFRCTETGIACLGTGTFNCIPESTTNCVRA